MREAFEIRSIKVNFLVFLFYWFVQVLTYIGLPIELESVGGNLYINRPDRACWLLHSERIESQIRFSCGFQVVYQHYHLTLHVFFPDTQQLEKPKFVHHHLLCSRLVRCKTHL